MLDLRQLSRVLSVGFDFGNERVCNRDVCSSHRSAPLVFPKSSASAGIAGMFILFWPLDCCSPTCPLPFGKPEIWMNLLTAVEKSWLAWEADLLFFPSLGFASS